MKHAILIQCHSNFDQIKLMTEFYKDKDIRFFIHIDKKSLIPKYLENSENVSILSDRIDVRWGQFSQVRATLNLFEAVKNSSEEYQYIHLISGQDVPLKSKESFKEMFNNNQNNYIEYSKLPCKWPKGGIDRYKVYYPLFLIQRTDKKICRIMRIIYREFILRSKIFKRKFTFMNDIYGGSQWFSINTEAFKYIIEFLENNEQYTKFFENSLCADELFFHTIILNSTLKSTVVNNNLRYIDWTNSKNGSPKELTNCDFKKVSDEKIFARKVNDFLVFKQQIKNIKHRSGGK